MYLVHWFNDPVDTRITTNSFVLGVDKDNFEILVGRVLIDPVGVENSEIGTTTTDTLLGSRLERTLVLELVHTLVGGFACGIELVSCLSSLPLVAPRTVCSTLWHWLLAASPTNTHTVDDITLLGLITQTAGFVWTRWT